MIATGQTLPTPVCLDGIAASTRRVRRWAEPPEWLAPGERDRATRMRDGEVRDAWLTARLAAKRLVAARLPGWPAERVRPYLAGIEIDSRDARGRGARPRALVGGREVAIALSIAHAGDRVLVAVGPAAAPLGVDLTPATAFVRPACRWWLTTAEHHDARLLSGAAAAEQAARLWSIKEAVYKAVLGAEPFRPRAIEVRFQGGRITSCVAAGRSLPAEAIRTWQLAGHWLALVHAPHHLCGAEA